MKPVLQALVLADRVYEDKNGKKIICGTFNRLYLTTQAPTESVQTPEGETKTLLRGGMAPAAPYAYISLTDVCDDTTCELQFVSLTRNEVIFKTQILIKCDDRLATVEFVAPLPQLQLPEPGVYAFEIVCEGEVIGSHRIQAL